MAHKAGAGKKGGGSQGTEGVGAVKHLIWHAHCQTSCHEAPGMMFISFC